MLSILLKLGGVIVLLGAGIAYLLGGPAAAEQPFSVGVLMILFGTMRGGGESDSD